jgi:hypothetical protein
MRATEDGAFVIELEHLGNAYHDVRQHLLDQDDRRPWQVMGQYCVPDWPVANK